jgi:hypothetical protein
MPGFCGVRERMRSLSPRTLIFAGKREARATVIPPRARKMIGEGSRDDHCAIEAILRTVAPRIGGMRREEPRRRAIKETQGG